MEPEGLLPSSQLPATGPYLGQMHPTTPSHPISLRSILILSSPSVPLSSKWSLPFRFFDHTLSLTI